MNSANSTYYSFRFVFLIQKPEEKAPQNLLEYLIHCCEDTRHRDACVCLSWFCIPRHHSVAVVTKSHWQQILRNIEVLSPPSWCCHHQSDNWHPPFLLTAAADSGECCITLRLVRSWEEWSLVLVARPWPLLSVKVGQRTVSGAGANTHQALPRHDRF